MGKVTEQEVCRRLNVEIRENYEELSWIGIKMDTISSLENVSVNIDDDSFYSGNGDYYFNVFVSFMVKTFDEDNNLIGYNTKRYVTQPHCKFNIKENDIDFIVKIIEPICLTPHH